MCLHVRNNGKEPSKGSTMTKLPLLRFPAKRQRMALLLAIPVALACGCSHCDDDSTRISQNGLSGEVQGSAEFTDDDRDVKSLSPGGLIRIEQGTLLNVSRSYEVRAGSGNVLYRVYRVRGKEQPLDESGKRWVSGAMLYLIRETGAGAPQRVQRILRSGGPAAVLTEVRAIDSDGSKRLYLRELIDNGRLNEDQFRDAMRGVERISSDGDKAALLIDVENSYLKPRLRDCWFTAAGTIGSDGDKKNVLEHAVERDGASAETTNLASKVAAGIGSDGDKAAVLTAIAGVYGPEIRHPYFRAVGSIGSDGDRSHVLIAVLKTGHSHPDTLADIMRATAGIGSDGDKKEVIEAAAQYDLGSEPVRTAFVSAVNSISSDGDRAAALKAVIKEGKPSSALLAAAADSAVKIGSDGDKAAVLRELANAGIADPLVRNSFFAAVNTIGSDGDHAAVLVELLSKPSLPPETTVAAIESAARIGSDGDKANVLVSAAGSHKGDPSVRSALQKALTTIQSDGDYRRVSNALLKTSG